ncbi:MAG: UDP-N-acetylmuramate:L-alanyl-gamma-D-glutamyl-meso-diaminopimelate ligase, partial [Deltaproteobacteria bacterium]|nr:UDP-N-acetylmuramate:L-alanyl-gamma-D-glutamyl-meso-diaminopimelate ligase [Deltaproteobacteria bacterium]
MKPNFPPLSPAPLLDPAFNSSPQNPRHIHLMGICGVGMASLAGMLKEKGCHVTGSDQNVYPPMSDFLEGLAIQVMEGYAPTNLNPAPDLVIVGNVITRQNPEALELAELGIPYLSMPQALREFAMKGQRPIVIAGTHGKTTTSALASWFLETGGLDPGFMVGGICRNFNGNFRAGRGPYFVIEGDEYDTAFFDKGPKFVHYAPWITILTSIEFDHADIYRDLDHVLQSFRSLIDIIPSDGLLIANGDNPLVLEEAKRAKCPVVTYGFTEGAEWSAADISYREEGTHLTVCHGRDEFVPLVTPIYGRHNISNLLSVVALSHFLKIDRLQLQKAAGTFTGIKRRQEIKGEKGGILVLDDFAHHPTAVRETILAVRERYRSRRLIAVFEPRSNSSRRNIFQEAYAGAFDNA